MSTSDCSSHWSLQKSTEVLPICRSASPCWVFNWKDPYKSILSDKISTINKSKVCMAFYGSNDQSHNELFTAFCRWVSSRPGNIQVFMYPGQVCNFQAGTHHTYRLAQKSKMDKKQDASKICCNARISESEIYQTYNSTHTEIQLFWNLFIIIVYLS